MDQCWTLTVDRDTCLGSGSCAATAPKHFRLEKGRSRPIDEVISPDDTVLDAAETCPAEAIAVYDARRPPNCPRQPTVTAGQIGNAEPAIAEALAQPCDDHRLLARRAAVEDRDGPARPVLVPDGMVRTKDSSRRGSGV